MKERVQRVLDILVCILLFIVSISKGGFYKEDILFPVVAIVLIGFVYCIIKIVLNLKENGKIKKNKLVTALDVLMIMLPIAYALPIVFKKYVSLENSIFEFMRYASTSIVYYIARTSKNKEIYLNLIFAIACVTTVLGIDEITYRVVESLPLHINYLPQNASVVSSMVQYANVAAILIILGEIIGIYKFQKTKKHRYVFAVIVMQSVVFLTTSRMALVVTCVLALFLCMLQIKRKDVAGAGTSIVAYVLALICAGIISSLVEDEIKYAPYVVYMVLMAVMCVVTCTKTYFKKRTEKIGEKLKNNKRLSVYICIVCLALGLIILAIPANVNVADATKTVKLSNLEVGKNDIYFEIENENEDTQYSVVVTKIYDTYKPEKLFELTQSSLVDGVFLESINIEEDIKYVEVSFSVTNGSITVKNATVNGKKTALSYMFMPDRLASRIKTDFVFDLNNSRRLEYYKDGIKLWLTSPAFGLGGEGFKLCYQSVQEESYISTEAHSGLVQVLVEAGAVGGASYILIAVIGIFIAVKLFKTDKKHMCYILSILVLYIMSTFDLMFSFAIITYIWGIILGTMSNEVINTKLKGNKYEYEADNTSFAAMLKLGAFCIATLVLGASSWYMLNVYMASMIKLPTVYEDSADYEDSLYEKITLLERKLEMDKYNVSYMMELDSAYYDYIAILKQVALSVEGDGAKDEANTILAKYILRQKANADNMVECEYFSKYAIEKVAICYFENYIRYAEVLSANFENDEVAYAFYLNYALKLTNRIKELGPVNTVAGNMYEGILKTYIEVLSRQNKYMHSTTIESVLQDMQKAIDMI